MPDLLHLLEDIIVTNLGPVPVLNGEVLSDSRLINTDDCFVAMQGSNFDGHDFIGQAISEGAKVIIHSKPLRTYQEGISYIQVTDSVKAIKSLGQAVYNKLPQKMVTVTGTNGKTSTVNMVRQLATMMDCHCASLGTIGLKIDSFPESSVAEVFAKLNKLVNLTTLPWLELRYVLSQLSRHKIEIAAMEASSHGLHQGRMEGLKFNAAAFTNLTQDHLDYHKTMEEYAAAKAKLFQGHLAEGATVVINSDSAYADFMASQAAQSPNLGQLITFGHTKPTRLYAMQQEHWLIENLEPVSLGLAIEVRVEGKLYSSTMPLLGRFQAENVLAALGLMVGVGFKFSELWQVVNNLHGVHGRMDIVRSSYNQVIVIDYAHTPDALEKALTEMKQHFSDRELVVVFGCGGDRDPFKRPIMGQIASKTADITIVTDDNPRNEDAASIRAQIMAGCDSGKQVIEIADRTAAIKHAMSASKKPRAILIAGKGHEQYQQVGDKKLPYSDYEVVDKP